MSGQGEQGVTAAIFLPIGVGIVIGLLICALAFGGVIVWFIANVLLIPFRSARERRTPEGRARWEAKKAAFGEIMAARRGTPEHRDAVARYRAMRSHGQPGWRSLRIEQRRRPSSNAALSRSHT